MWLEDDSVYMYTWAVDHLFVCILYCTDEVLHTYFVLHTQQHYVDGGILSQSSKSSASVGRAAAKPAICVLAAHVEECFTFSTA